MVRSKVLTAKFYATKSGSMPVREWLLNLEKRDRIEIGSDIANIEYNWPVGPPQCKPLEGGIFEVRSHISNRKIARTLFFIYRNELLLLHAFIKKTQKTSRRDLELAKKRKKEIEDN
jgi:phage-related protein